jgi:hypothetical protein
MIMSTAFWIAAQEVREKGRVFLTALVLACTPFLAMLRPMSRGHQADLVALAGMFVGLTMALGLAVAFGATTVVAALAERRMSYWFSKPVGAAALWAGKVMAALFTSFACLAIISAPALAFSKGGLQWPANEPWQMPLLAVACGIAVLFFLSHALSTMVRSRSIYLGIDVVAASVSVAVLALIARPLLLSQALPVMLGAVGIAVFLVLAVAPYWQLANGRTDLRRSHAAFSRALWTGVGIVLAIAALAIAWLTSARPQNFDRIRALQQSPAGNMVFVSGSAPYRRGIDTTFVLDPRTGESERISVPEYWGVTFSRDGRYAAWTEPGAFKWSTADIMVRDLETHTTRSPGLAVSLFSDRVFSDDGSRIAVRDRQTLSVIDITTKKVLAAMPLQPRRDSFWFASRDVVRVLSNGNTNEPMKIVELDLRTKKASEIGRTAPLTRPYAPSVSADGSRMLLRADGLIADARTGQTIATIPVTRTRPWASVMLHDGRVLAANDDGAGTNLNLHDRDGVFLRTIRIPTRGVVVGERSDGKVLYAARHQSADGKASRNTIFVLDVEHGVIERTLPDMRGPEFLFSTDPRLVMYSASARLASADATGRLVYWK